MNRTTKTAAAALAVLLAALSCAKMHETGPHEAEQRYLKAWMEVNHPGIEPTGKGIYILSDEPGAGKPIDDSTAIFIRYTLRSLEGKITESNIYGDLIQTGTYEEASYHGPKLVINRKENLQAGVMEGFRGMRLGGKRTFIVPAWLFSYKDYENPSDYLADKTDGTTKIYEVEIVEATNDLTRWQFDKMKEYSAKHLGGIDSTSLGFYYKSLKAPAAGAKEWKSDTTFYINYTGRLLDGLVFDTTLKDTAKVHGLYSSSKTYSPVKISWAAELSDVTMTSGSTSSSTISGFVKTLAQMKNLESGVGMFYSELGYGAKGSGTIPGYAPLIFEIQVVKQ